MPSIVDLNARVTELFQASALAHDPDYLYTNADAALDAMTRVGFEHPLSMWLFGQFLVLKDFAMATGRLVPKLTTPLGETALRKCYQRMMSSEQHHPEFFDQVNALQTAGGLAMAPVNDIENLTSNAPCEDIALFLHGVLTVRSAIAEAIA